MEAPYKAFFDRSLEAMYLSTREGLFLEVNQAFAYLLGYTRVELIGTSVEKTLSLPLERRRFRYEMDSHGAVSQFRLKLLSKAGDEIPTFVDAVALRDPHGAIEAYVGLVRPIKKSLPALTTLDRELKRLSLSVAGANDGLWDWDLVKSDAYFNQRWKDILGFEIPEIGSRIHEWFDRIHVQDLAPVKQALAAVVRGASSSFQIHFRIQRKDGKWLWALGRGVGDYNEAGRCVRIAGSMSDVTAHIRLVEKERSQSQRLEELNASLRQDRSLLSQYFSGDMLSTIFQEGKASLPGNAGPATVLQIRFHGVENLWERIGAETYATLLNDLVTDVMDLVYGCRGAVNKILGDTLLVTFGCPLAEADDLERALRAASEIRGHLRTFNDVRPDFLEKPVALSMGLASGEVFSGTVGSVHRLEFAAVGAPVNRAAELQALAAARGVELLVDEASLPLGAEGFTPAVGAPGALAPD